MEIKEKTRKVYQKYGMTVGDKMMEYIINNPERRESIIHLYKQEEIENMNYILGKSEDNKIFTKFELEACSKIDLFDRAQIEWCKLFWENRNNEENYQQLHNALNERRCPKCI